MSSEWLIVDNKQHKVGRSQFFELGNLVQESAGDTNIKILSWLILSSLVSLSTNLTDFNVIHIDLSKAKSPENEVNVISSLLAGPKFYKQEIFC